MPENCGVQYTTHFTAIKLISYQKSKVHKRRKIKQQTKYRIEFASYRELQLHKNNNKTKLQSNHNSNLVNAAQKSPTQNSYGAKFPAQVAQSQKDLQFFFRFN
jgi:hypothetical protein